MSTRYTFFLLLLLALLAPLSSAFSDTHAKRGHTNSVARNHLELSSTRRSEVNSTLSGPEKRGLATFSWFVTGLGACGTVNSPDDFIVAINKEQWDGGSHCYEYVTITIGGKSTQAQIVDRCQNCSYDGLDFTTGLFTYFNPDLGTGLIYGEWSYNSGASSSTTATTSTTTKTSTRHSTTSSTIRSTSTRASSSSSSASSPISATSVTSSVWSTVTSASTSATPSSTADADSGSGDQTFDSGTLTQFSLALIHLAEIADAGLVVSLGS